MSSCCKLFQNMLSSVRFLRGARGEVAPSLPTLMALGQVISSPSVEGAAHSFGRSRMSRRPATPRPRPRESNRFLFREIQRTYIKK